MAAPGIFPAIDLIGGGVAALDRISSTAGKVIQGTPGPLETGDAAIVFTTSGIYSYIYDAASMAVEDATNYTVIRPDDIDPANPGRWIIEYHLGSWDTERTVQISSGVAALSGRGRYRLQVETGSLDDLDKVTGLPNGHEAILVPDDGAKPITVKHGTFLKLERGRDFTMNNVRDKMIVLGEGSDVASETTRSSIES